MILFFDETNKAGNIIKQDQVCTILWNPEVITITNTVSIVAVFEFNELSALVEVPRASLLDLYLVTSLEGVFQVPVVVLPASSAWSHIGIAPVVE